MASQNNNLKTNSPMASETGGSRRILIIICICIYIYICMYVYIDMLNAEYSVDVLF